MRNQKKRTPAGDRNGERRFDGNAVIDLNNFREEKPSKYKRVEITPRNLRQEDYLAYLENPKKDMVFALGPAGTGKTLIATLWAVKQLKAGQVDRIVVTRPAVSVDEQHGFLPGTLEEKYAPYLEPFDSVFSRSLGRGFYEYALKSKDIEPKPLGFMRGSTFDDCIVLLDEAQNATRDEMKMLLSRIGKNCKMIISGDVDQSDIPESGLSDAVNRLDRIPGIEVVRFLDEDIVRSKMCKQIILAYRD